MGTGLVGVDNDMKIETYWWGVELFPENDEEWKMLLRLFDGAEVPKSYKDGEVTIFEANEREDRTPHPRMVRIDR